MICLTLLIDIIVVLNCKIKDVTRSKKFINCINILTGPGTDNSSSKLPNENVPTTQSMQQPPSSSQQPIVSSPQGASVSSSSKTVMSNTTSMAHSMASDSHFLQQQSQIFVFSTRMANDAAELVMAGKYKNILNFHTDQPETQNFLQVMKNENSVNLL